MLQERKGLTIFFPDQRFAKKVAALENSKFAVGYFPFRLSYYKRH
jgi:hypothetical protein